MIDPARFLSVLTDAGIHFVAGVPDSLLHSFCSCLIDSFPAHKHIVACSEGGAVGLAIGHHVATGDVPLVYLQNSGLGNVVNPIASLADSNVFRIPIILMIGWRSEVWDGDVQRDDEPQHVRQGLITLGQLNLLNIPYEVLDEHSDDFEASVRKLVGTARRTGTPAALVIRNGTFGPYRRNEPPPRARIDIAGGCHRTLCRSDSVQRSSDLYDRDGRAGVVRDS
ncbi:phosphonopyruvate decarboxylase [Pandoraea terrae]|uniref:Phosphonopyruvate decarboxylase n=1 Tax=Pandoraea terrae TaxID=1537710 RepID=A0A5E4SRB3_9BURK|nr:thiamine pyrophosphate-binding protein [Pandoraea terrae]VVD76389.1 phosphonopyruvate decarboxylase [Pandoraea terrae]